MLVKAHSSLLALLCCRVQAACKVPAYSAVSVPVQVRRLINQVYGGGTVDDWRAVHDWDLDTDGDSSFDSPLSDGDDSSDDDASSDDDDDSDDGEFGSLSEPDTDDMAEYLAAQQGWGGGLNGWPPLPQYGGYNALAGPADSSSFGDSETSDSEGQVDVDYEEGAAGSGSEGQAPGAADVQELSG